MNPTNLTRTDWPALAELVIPQTNGTWMQIAWLYVPGSGKRELCGMTLQPLAGGPLVDIESAEQFEQFLQREVRHAEQA